MKTLKQISITILALGFLSFISAGGGGEQQLSPIIANKGVAGPVSASIQQLSAAYGVDIQVYPSTVNQTEVSIALNWCNTINMLIGANTDPGQGYYYTHNSGSSWDGGNSLPGVGYFSSDPAVVYDVYNIGNPNGYSSGYFNYLEDVGSGYRVFVKKTTDGGTTWLDSVRIPDNRNYLDKNHITSDPTSGTYSNNL